MALSFCNNGKPATEFVERVRRTAAEKGVLLLSSGPDDNVIRIMPPPTIPPEDLEQGMDIFEDVLREAINVVLLAMVTVGHHIAGKKRDGSGGGDI